MDMLSLIIGILGTLFTIFFGYVAIRISQKEKKVKKISFLPTECYSLFDVAVKRLNIDIKYKDLPVNNSLIFLRQN